DHCPATVAVENQPVMRCSGNLGLEPRTTFGREPRIESADGCQRVALRFPLTPHPRDVTADFLVAAIVGHCVGPFA
ncbi:MAG: hypothetical protein WB839_16210, partial [Pseudolabrys sp.]